MADNDYLTARIDGHEARLEKVENRVGALERDGAVLGERMSNIQTTLTDIKGGVRTVMWWAIGAVVTPIIGAIMAFIIRGGLHV